MATVTHYIRSSYDPESQREGLLAATNQPPDQPSNDSDSASTSGTSYYRFSRTQDVEGGGLDPWVTESTFSAQRRVAGAPRFVKAIIRDGEWGMVGPDESGKGKERERERGEEGVAGWYRKMVLERERSGTSGVTMDHTVKDGTSTSVSAPPSLPSSPKPTPQPHPLQPNRPRKQNWFVSKPLSMPGTPAPTRKETLADILARSPPPDAREGRVEVPVFLGLGPENRGWGMLERSGWREGEGLGVYGRRGLGSRKRREEKGKREVIDVDAGVEVIDLTLSDSEAEGGSEEEDGKEEETVEEVYEYDPSRKALLTPLATVFKADKLGIGVRAKKGRRRVTHASAAMREHVKRTAEMKRKREEVGRGRRAFERLSKQEQEQRRALLGYMNTAESLTR
ncbi:hypothetical protein JAAARDRAFT_455313 [Jaapia argillacea MUCL 33604]|uniref:G-patch domain-containing protein n=1 Tax=Jaapia argillacea MUCL 33604 TaxID=933084 RepID=A0A067Q811_9AGAM|nr:hypothetical protein JAAARDRAFT_455313 [Jaapia argillacea MUCL 33604]